MLVHRTGGGGGKGDGGKGAVGAIEGLVTLACDELNSTT